MKREERSAKRSEVVLRMRGAFRTGRSASSFITEMKTRGISYRRTEMLADWRTVNEIESKKGLLRYVRRDYYPTGRSIAQVEWDLSQEYMYTLKIKHRRGDEPSPTDKFVNILSDMPLTPGQVERELFARWRDYQATSPQLQDGVPEGVVVESAFRRIGSRS